MVLFTLKMHLGNRCPILNYRG